MIKVVFGLSGQELITIARYIGAGIAIGAGAIGPAVGMGIAAGGAAEGISERPKMEGRLIRTMFMGQAVASSTGIYALVIAFILVFVVESGGQSSAVTGQNLIVAVKYLAAGLAMGGGAIGSGIGEGIPVREACRGMSRRPKLMNVLLRTMFAGQAVAESTGIYSLVIAFILIFVV